MNKLMKLSRSDYLLLAAAFFLSFPIMWLIKVYAIFARGFVIWFVPWFLSPLGESILGIPATTGTTIVFMIAAALQNTLITWLYLKYKDRSKFVSIAYRVFVGALIFIVLAIFLRHYMTFGQLLPATPPVR